MTHASIYYMSKAGVAAIASSYQDALRILDGQKRPSRPLVAHGDALHTIVADVRGTPSIHGMRNWLQLLGHSDEDLKALNVIHVAGTKGKGSTSAFTDSILRAHGLRTGFPAKTGLYTSPHLIIPEERIRLNFKPLSQDLFAKYFFDVYNSLQQASEVKQAPRYLQLWALTAIHTFIMEKVDVTIIETHHGGEYDATNFLKSPIVTAVTTLGMDHVQQLGPSLKDIAWHKAGIFKHGALAVSAPQDADAASVLRKRAADKNVQLIFAEAAHGGQAALLPADVLRTNCGVAIAAARAFLQRTALSSQLDETDLRTGIKDFSWPGRFQHVSANGIDWFLDSAHNELSVGKAAQWYAEASAKLERCVDHPSTQSIVLLPADVLLFSHMSELRDWEPLLRKLLESLRKHDIQFSVVVFTTYKHLADTKDGTTASTLEDDNDKLFRQFEQVLYEYYPQTRVHTRHTIDKAIALVQQLVEPNIGAKVFVTGSQHLVGGVIRCLTLATVSDSELLKQAVKCNPA